jgi:hypothetical protein
MSIERAIVGMCLNRRYHDLVVGIAICLPITVLYLTGVQRSIGMGDSAEFVIAAYTLGIPHPTGYPLYVWLGRIFSLLPVGSIPFRVSLISAASASLGLLVVFLITAGAVWELARDRVTGYVCGILAVTMLGLSRAFMQYAEVAEVYAMNVLCVMLSVYLALEWFRSARPAHLYGASLILGLSLGTHMSNILLVPVLLGAVMLAGRKTGRNIKHLSASMAMVALGASQYLFLLVRADQASAYLNPAARLFEKMPATGTDNPFSNWVWFVTGGPWHGHYTQTFAGAVSKVRQIQETILSDYGIAGLAVALAGIALPLILRRRSADALAGAGLRWLTLIGVLVAQFAYYIAYKPSTAGMVLPLMACLAALAALGAASIATLVGITLPGPGLGAWGKRAVAAIVTIVLCFPILSRPVIKYSRHDAAARLVGEMIRRLPPGSTVDGVDWKFAKIIDYYRIVECREIPFALAECDGPTIAAGKGYVLGIPKAVNSYRRAGHDLKPYLSAGDELTLFQVE